MQEMSEYYNIWIKFIGEEDKALKIGVLPTTASIFKYYLKI